VLVVVLFGEIMRLVLYVVVLLPVLVGVVVTALLGMIGIAGV
jgi:hypothetical protein